MRVFVKPRDERGAVAAMVGLLAVALLVLSGFTVDYGQAFVAKRNLQKAADAGALAAAQKLSRVPGTCQEIASGSAAAAARETARLAADDYRKRNRESYLPDSTQLEWQVDCTADNKSLVVRYGVQGATPSLFGPLAGTGNTITANRRAEAVLEVAPYAGTAMRPLAMCSTQLTAGPYVRLDYPTNAPPQCGNAAGAWWTVDCPGNPSNSTAVMVQQVRDGCPRGASVVAGQTNTDPTNTLKAACARTASDGTCLESNPGNLDSGQVADSWKYLVDQETRVVFPVFCAPPQCSSTTVDGQGNNASFPVYKLLGAVLCGYHFSKNDSDRYVPRTGECGDMPTNLWTAADWDSNGANFLIIKYAAVSTSGSQQPSECGLGSTTGCDGGARRTRLAQ